MRLPKFKKPNLKLILLYYSVILSTILIIGGVYSNRSIKEIISNIYDIAAGDKYVISHEDKLANAIWKYTSSTLTSFGTLVSDIWFNSPRTLTDYASSTIATAVWSNSTRTFSEFSSLAADIWNIWNSTFAPKTLASRQIGTSTEYIASQATLEAVRSSQQEGWTIYLSDIGQLLAGKTYWVKVTILNYESVPTDPYATSTITIYDASRNIVVENVQMTKISTGVYEYTYNIPSSAGAGLWETVVSTEVETGKTIIVNDHWEVESSPAEVKINQITDHTISSITANATITNEDSGDYEYQYEYCIVSSLENQCGGGDDIDYAKTVKYIQAGQSWTTDLTLSASSVGTYYFKMVVYWGTERFEDYKQFEAIKEVTPLSESGGGDEAITSSKPPSPTLENTTSSPLSGEAVAGISVAPTEEEEGEEEEEEEIATLSAPEPPAPQLPPLKERKFNKQLWLNESPQHFCTTKNFKIDVSNNDLTIVELEFNGRRSDTENLEIGSLPLGIDIAFLNNGGYEWRLQKSDSGVILQITNQPGSQKGNFNIPIIYQSGDSTAICQINVINF